MQLTELKARLQSLSSALHAHKVVKWLKALPYIGRWINRRVLAIALLCVLAILVLIGLLSSSGPVPKDIRSSVNFTIYYPKQAKLPDGYTLNTRSFRLAQPGVLIFSVTYGNGREMIFSEEERPSKQVLDKFDSSAIPLHTELNTPLGKAIIGSYGSGTNTSSVVSLPIIRGPWLIITAPSTVNPADLTKVIQSIGK